MMLVGTLRSSIGINADDIAVKVKAKYGHVANHMECLFFWWSELCARFTDNSTFAASQY